MSFWAEGSAPIKPVQIRVLPGSGDWLNLAWPHAGRGSWTRVDLAPEMFGALVHDGGLVWSSGVPGSLVGVLVVDR